MNLNGIIVKESPRKRYYKKMISQYKAKWVLDLHSNDLSKDRVYDFEKELLAYLFLGGEYERNKDLGRYRAFAEWGKKTFPTYKRRPSPVMVLEAGIEKPRNFIGVELLNHNPRSASIELVKKLAESLYIGSF